MRWLLCFMPIFLAALNLVEFAKAACLKSHLQTNFCRFDFVALVTVKDVLTGNQNFPIFYHVSIDKLFKDSKSSYNGYGNMIIQTPNYSERVDYTINEQYLIGSNMKYGESLTVQVCDISERWSDITPLQKVGLSGLYANNCHCQINGKFRTYDSNFLVNNYMNTCNSKNGVITKCDDQFQFCGYDFQSGACSWRRTKDYETCAKKKPF